jgi:hypothetical protein
MRFNKVARIFSFMSLFPLILAGEHQQATVRIQNNTPNPISGVRVVHKYSDEYKNNGAWLGVVPAYSVSEESMTVDYTTGIWELGRDWWSISYHRELETSDQPPSPLDLDTSVEIWYSDPENFRSIIDFLEGAAPSLVEAGVDALLATQPGVALTVEAAAGIATDVLCNYLFNDESTAGFKQHILRNEDAGFDTIIHINDDNTIRFESNSGDSETVASTKWIPIGRYLSDGGVDVRKRRV